MGRALAPLRHEHILLVATGGIVHNLARLQPEQDTPYPEPWAAEFDRWVREKAGALDVDALAATRAWRPTRAPPCRRRSTSTRCCSSGTVLPGDVVYDIYEGFRYGTLSMRSFVLTGRRREDRGF